MKIDNAKISCFPDFSAELQKQRAKFIDIKRRLRALDIKYAMLYPSKLRVEALGSVHFFDLPSSAAQWLDREERSLRDGRIQRRAQQDG